MKKPTVALLILASLTFAQTAFSTDLETLQKMSQESGYGAKKLPEQFYKFYGDYLEHQKNDIIKAMRSVVSEIVAIDTPPTTAHNERLSILQRVIAITAESLDANNQLEFVSFFEKNPEWTRYLDLKVHSKFLWSGGEASYENSVTNLRNKIFQRDLKKESNINISQPYGTMMIKTHTAAAGSSQHYDAPRHYIERDFALTSKAPAIVFLREYFTNGTKVKNFDPIQIVQIVHLERPDFLDAAIDLTIYNFVGKKAELSTYIIKNPNVFIYIDPLKKPLLEQLAGTGSDGLESIQKNFTTYLSGAERYNRYRQFNSSFPTAAPAMKEIAESAMRYFPENWDDLLLPAFKDFSKHAKIQSTLSARHFNDLIEFYTKHMKLRSAEKLALLLESDPQLQYYTTRVGFKEFMVLEKNFAQFPELKKFQAKLISDFLIQNLHYHSPSELEITGLAKKLATLDIEALKSVYQANQQLSNVSRSQVEFGKLLKHILDNPDLFCIEKLK